MNGLIILVLMLIVYFLPTIVARYRFHRNTAGVFVLNLFAGWTMIGWIGALVWSTLVQDDKK